MVYWHFVWSDFDLVTLDNVCSTEQPFWLCCQFEFGAAGIWRTDTLCFITLRPLVFIRRAFSPLAKFAKVQFSANTKVATAGAEGVVGHNGYGIVNIGFRETQLEGKRREISIEYMCRRHWRPRCSRIDFPFWCVTLDFRRCSVAGTCH